MIRINVDGVTATVTEKEVLTAGRVGLECAFTFTGEWEGLFKTAVFQGVESVDVALPDNTCTVPWEAMQVEGVQLKIGVFGANGAGTIVIPTIWANAGKIQPSAVGSGTEPTEPSQNANAYAVETAEEAKNIALSVKQRADDGEFDGATGPDGFSPSASVSKAGRTATITITDKDGTTTASVSDGLPGADGADGSNIWTSEVAPIESIGLNPTYAFNLSDLEGDLGIPKTGDLVFYSSAYYPIASLTSTRAVCSRRVSIKGDPGADGQDGQDGQDGDPGPAGPGVPAGGTTGQVLKKASGTDYDTEWANESGGGSVDPYTSTPADLGTASAGSSDDYARGDHVHKMPSASDVGAIAAPGSPSAGDVLTYSSGVWAAAAPAHQIPAGGNAGECLAKNSATDYDLRWRTINDWTPAGLMRTNGGTAAKVAEWSFWSATQYPSWLVVTVGNSNTYAGAITLKVNGSTAYPIHINGVASSATNYTLPAGSYFVYFDGTKFDFRTDGKIPGDITGHSADPTEVTVSTAGAVTQALDAGKIYHFTGALTALTITLNAAASGQLAHYHCDFDCGSTAPSVSIPNTVTMPGGNSFDANKHYEVDILNNYGAVLSWANS